MPRGRTWRLSCTGRRRPSSARRHRFRGRTSLASLRQLLGATATGVLFEPVQSWRRTRCHERALAALENYQTGIEDLIRGLPQTIDRAGPGDSGNAAAGQSRARPPVSAGAPPPAGATRRPIDCGAPVSAGCGGPRRHRRRRFCWRWPRGRCCCWRRGRQSAMRRLPGLRGRAAAIRNSGEGLARWRERSEPAGARGRTKRRTASPRGATAVTERLAEALLRGDATAFAAPAAARAALPADVFPALVAPAARGEGGVGSGIRAGPRGDRPYGGVRTGAESLDREQAGLLAELDNVAGWLREAQHGEPSESFPPPQAELVSAEDRVSRLGAGGGSLRGSST